MCSLRPCIDKFSIADVTNLRKFTTPFLGPSDKLLDIVKVVKENDDKIFLNHYQMKIVSCMAKLISEGNIIGWVRGQLEFGEALGNRSILDDPRDPQMKKSKYGCKEKRRI